MANQGCHYASSHDRSIYNGSRTSTNSDEDSTAGTSVDGFRSPPTQASANGLEVTKRALKTPVRAQIISGRLRKEAPTRFFGQATYTMVTNIPAVLSTTVIPTTTSLVSTRRKGGHEGFEVFAYDKVVLITASSSIPLASSS